ncbi:mechanosensitive ion channel family protein [Mycoplana dimorpha]|uniref:Small-conductance mechanosensitive channel n=1 Tax=Mycoplana dimorpha TaxID=28320 RepID=A0A2T5BBY3_MYCDI|nr:mechanosensitive ion channel family protein [Mycoplana dimorpha]PTM96494.1 small-conductance mechanosensitive channel [Mycoplana dimorpha]
MRALLVLLATLLAFQFAAQLVLAQTPAPTSDKVDQLLKLLDDPSVKEWLASKPTRSPVTTPAAAPAEGVDQGMMSSALDRVQAHLTRLFHSWPMLPQRFETLRHNAMQEVGDKGGLGVAALIVLFVGVGAILSYIAFRLVRPLRLWTIAQDKGTPQGRVGKFGGRFLVGFVMLGSFMVGSAGIFLLFEWPPLLREIVLAFLTAAIAIWGVRIAFQVVLLPSFMGVAHAREVRAFDISDARADHWYRWILAFASVVAVAAAALSLLPRFGFTPDDVLALAAPIEVALLIIALCAVWRRPVTRPEDLERPRFFSHKATSWLLTVYFVLLFLIRVSGANVAFWSVVAAFAVPFAIVMVTRAVNYVLRPPEGEDGAAPPPAVIVAVVDRAIRLMLIVLAAYLLANVWGLDMTSMAATSPIMTLFLRGLLNAAIVVLGADFAWSIIKAVIQRKLGVQGPVTATDGEAVPVLDPQQARLRTLLPILQNIMLAIIIVMAVLMVLSSVGIQIGPLIAGAGVVGVAVGFGAQTIVKDVIAGVFYLLDDAFRVGEYITAGKYSGTVESFSLRSVKLRHHRGPIYTIPFGELGAVRNGSRDWSTDKFNIMVGFDTDIDLARKLIKRIGLELAEDPEYKPWIIRADQDAGRAGIRRIRHRDPDEGDHEARRRLRHEAQVLYARARGVQAERNRAAGPDGPSAGPAGGGVVDRPGNRGRGRGSTSAAAEEGCRGPRGGPITRHAGIVPKSAGSALKLGE